MADTKKILFICTGNICRSPSAEAILRQLARDADIHLTVDSAGTGNWHTGEAPDARARHAAEQRGYSMAGIKARQVTADDLQRFDIIYAMAKDHLHYMQALADSATRDKTVLFLPATTGAGGSALEDVPDPYFGSAGGFEHMMDLLEAGCREIIRRLK